MGQVHIRKINPKQIAREIGQLLSGAKYFPQKTKIFIKPNICGFYNSKSPCIVNPQAVGGIIEYLRDSGCKDIIVGELPVPDDVDKVFEISGYKFLSRHYNVKLLNLNEVERALLRLKDFDVSIPTLLLDKEYEYINIAKMKTHIQTTVSLCTKNQKGLLDFSGRKMMHTGGDLHENVKLLAETLKPDFCIIEGINALQGDGPGATGRELKEFNIVIAGKNIEEVDWVGSQAMGINPETIKHLLRPKEKIDVQGQEVRDIRRIFLLSKDHFQKLHIHFWLTEKTCSGCSEIMGQLKRGLMKSPLRLVKFLCLAFFGRIDILTGDVSIPSQHGKIICLGNCMSEKAKKYNLRIMGGCPPAVDNFFDVLR